ncbi:MAG: sulfatase-like hydrolase/transferase [Fuerstiella sp.]
MKKLLLIVWATTLVGGLHNASAAHAAKPGGQPNIIIIMSDDMGYSDIGCYGGEIQTPVLDGLAKQGLRFTQFYNTGRCCPTRASLLTGLYPHQTGIGHMMDDKGIDGYRGDLNRSCVTIAEALKPAGYATYMVGKWHVTKHTHPEDEADKFNWPLQRGFDRYYGIINGASSLWDPNSLTRDNRPITIRNDAVYQPSEPYHFTDAISDNASMFINQHDGSKPFFMYVAYTAAHWPMHARERDIAKYDGQYDAGYEPIRQTRLEKMKQLGVVEPHAKPCPTVGPCCGGMSCRGRRIPTSATDATGPMFRIRRTASTSTMCTKAASRPRLLRTGRPASRRRTNCAANRAT